MPAVIITTTDLAPFATIEPTKAQGMIDDAMATAAWFAPCILDSMFGYTAAAKAILRGAILRWNDAGSGALSSQTAGPFGQTIDTRQQRRGMFWPSEIEQLQDLCKGDEINGAFSVDTAPAVGLAGHSPFCNLMFPGGTYCSCGANLTNYQYPIYGPLV